MNPFDTNIVYLESEAGNPPSTYINASWVRYICLTEAIMNTLY